MTPRSSKPPQDLLTLSANGLRDAIAKEAVGHERQWAEHVLPALSKVEVALRTHLAAVMDPTAEIDKTRPTLARRAEELQREHGDLLAAVHHLGERLGRAVQAFQPTPAESTVDARGIVDLAAIKHEAEQLLAQLHEHREAEIDLIQETVDTDIGVGD